MQARTGYHLRSYLQVLGFELYAYTAHSVSKYTYLGNINEVRIVSYTSVFACAAAAVSSSLSQILHLLAAYDHSTFFYILPLIPSTALN